MIAGSLSAIVRQFFRVQLQEKTEVTLGFGIASFSVGYIGSELFGGVMFGVKLACRFGMVFGLQVMPMGGRGMLSGGSTSSFLWCFAALR